MLKKYTLYLAAFILLVLSFLYINQAYRQMMFYNNLSNQANLDYIHFQNLSRQINNAVVSTPQLEIKNRSFGRLQLFFTDSTEIIQQLNLLHSAAADTINDEVIEKLDIKIRSELSWILNSNVPDSLINNKASEHISALQLIDSLLKQGMARTNFLLDENKKALNKAINRMKTRMNIISAIACLFLLYILIVFSRLKTKNEKKFRALVEHGEDVILLTTKEGKVMYVSPLIEKLTGFTVQDLMDKNIVMMMHRDYVNASKEIFKRLLKSPGLSIPGSNRLIKKNGGYIDVEGTVSNFLDDKSVGAVITNFRDITQRKLAQEKLASSESRFRSLIENNTDIILMLDNNFKVIYRGPSSERIFGWTDKDVVGNDGLYYIHPDDRATSKNILSEILSKPGIPVKFSCRNLHKNGHYIWVEGYATNFLPNENIKALVFNFHDITEQREAAEKLIQSEAHFRMLFDQGPDGIFIMDAQGNYADANLSVSKMLGYGVDELIGKNINDTVLTEEALQLPEDLSRFTSGVSSEWNFLRKDGTVFIGEVIGSILPEGHLQVILRDITDRREVEEKLIRSEQIYRTIASSIPGCVICLLDTDFRFTLIEGDILEALGYSKEKLLGSKMEDVLESAIFEKVAEQFKQVMQGEIITRELVVNGYDIISRFIPLKDENNEVYAIMTVAIDITEIKNAHRQIVEFNETLEQKVIERTSQLEAANKELQQFAYIASHDLQQPLRTISNYMQIFEEDYLDQLDENAHKYLRSVNKATKRMGNLVNSLLDFSKLSHNKKLTQVDCSHLIAEVISDLDAIIKDSGAVIEVSEMPHLNLYEIEIRQLFQNLILNAIKFQVNGNRPEIKISSEFTGNKWEFSVSDNGIGIDPTYFDRIFNIFQRLDNNFNYEGNGIGLANCKKIVQLHSGKIWVESIKGKGSTFHFTIPILTV